MNNYRKRKPSKPVDKTVKYRFWNNGLEYECSITSPIDIPNYRLKEVFDNTFVGKTGKKVDDIDSYSAFKKLSVAITCEVKAIKEALNV